MGCAPHATFFLIKGIMGSITYSGEVPQDMKPLERVLLMEYMAKLWVKWPCEGMEDIDKWKWGVYLAHHKAAARQSVLTTALCDVCTYETGVHGTDAEHNGPEWESIIKHILQHAEYLCRKDGQPVNMDM